MLPGQWMAMAFASCHFAGTVLALPCSVLPSTVGVLVIQGHYHIPVLKTSPALRTFPLWGPCRSGSHNGHWIAGRAVQEQTLLSDSVSPGQPQPPESGSLGAGHSAGSGRLSPGGMSWSSLLGFPLEKGSSRRGEGLILGLFLDGNAFSALFDP